MNFDDGAAYTHFCYAKSSKKGSSSKKIAKQIDVQKSTKKGEVVFRPRSTSKTLNSMFLAGEASYRPEKHSLGN